MKNKTIKEYESIDEKNLDLEKIIDEYSGYIYTIIQNMSANIFNQEDIEEIISDTFFILWKNQNKIDKEKSLSSYIAGIARNLVKEKLRKTKNNYNVNNLENDFFDVSKPIEVEITLSMNEIEFGYFDDLFDLGEENTITIKAVQETPNDRIEYSHSDTGVSISYNKIRNLPCVYYNSINAPDELNFLKNKNSGKFLNSLIESYIQINNINVNELINSDKIDLISSHLNTILNMINFVSNNDLKVDFERNIMEFIPRLIELKDKKNISVNKMGSGIRFSSYIYFELLNVIMNTIQNKFDSVILTNDGKKYISIFILLDEPEIHLHPYMQRSVINDVRNILKNNDSNFLKLLKSVFDIDGIFGQLIVVTHSPNIISNNFHEIIRLDYYKSIINAFSDFECQVDEKDEKNFLNQSDRIKELFFSKSCIIVEGITERKALPIFAEKLNIDLDGMNIGILQADGGDTIKSLTKVLKHFGIKCIPIIDRDIYDNKKNKEEFKDFIVTDYRFFEEDYIENIIKNKRRHVLYSLMKVTGTDLKLIIQKSQIENITKKLKIDDFEIKDYFLKDVLMNNDEKILLVVFTTWLSYNKKSNFSIELANNSEIIDIPIVYQNALRRAEKYAK